MKKFILFISLLFIVCFSLTQVKAQERIIDLKSINSLFYPKLNDEKPDIPSPFIGSDGNEYVIAVNKDVKYGIIPVTLRNDRGICKQLVMDTADFPALVRTGLHDDIELANTQTITGKPLLEITRDGLPGGLSWSGFMAADENIHSVLKGDNHLVKEMGLTHPELAKPLFHVLNMMDEDLAIDRWNMAIHQWDHIKHFFYNDKKVNVIARDTKGGQKSIFNDGIGGVFHITLWRELDENEMRLLKKNYSHLSTEEFEELKKLLSKIDTGEMEPQYIMRYGFYEGHTGWRADPIAIAFIFGLKSLSELEQIFNNDLYSILTTHFTD